MHPVGQADVGAAGVDEGEQERAEQRPRDRALAAGERAAVEGERPSFTRPMAPSRAPMRTRRPGLACRGVGAVIASTVAQLVVRHLDEELVRALEQRAARTGRSAEAEHREILREALVSELRRPSFKRFLLELPAVGDDADFVVARGLRREPAP